MLHVVILGFGNIGSNLCNALHEESQVSVVQVFNRNLIKLPNNLKSIPFTSNISEIKKADIYIIAIPDDAIADFSATLPFNDKLVVHTSGSVPMQALDGKNKQGVFYPLQTFTKNNLVDFSEIPVCIEAEEETDLKLLRTLGEHISKHVTVVSSEERKTLHLAAVFVNNFVNYMYHISEDILKENNLDFELLKPLIAETANKIKRLSPKQAQTGPAKRNDVKTIENHLHLLKDSPYKKVYQQLTKAIQDTYGKKL
ncbi:Rossmann-like and DUF2520 domain-containing protein [Marixanthomonas ophiurae]|uniref:DUF2520 domain-containing protein n=1 Tax=Marixanthomonas ophiurae TaxID=387659 RepID=A0A3E1Q8D5_9FLAO|nr:DUF2520 domain-containing protein [Marixanthomonas ophiurae]RFN58393.1 DUF2520 domain-containing protein [Marixanthomonas ophiurae]